MMLGLDLENMTAVKSKRKFKARELILLLRGIIVLENQYYLEMQTEKNGSMQLHWSGLVKLYI